MNEKDIAEKIKMALQNPSPFVPMPKTEEDLRNDIMNYFNMRVGYYAQDYHITNSFITHVLKCEGIVKNNDFLPKDALYKAFDFGKAFEELLFDNFVIYDTLTTDDYHKMSVMKENFVMPNYFVRDYELRGLYSYKERNLKVKGKIDLITEGKIIDIKTTAKYTKEAFLKNCEEFGYFSQGYLYKHLSGFDNFEIQAYSKTKTDRFWVIEFTENQFEEGKQRFEQGLAVLEKYDLLKHFVE